MVLGLGSGQEGEVWLDGGSGERERGGWEGGSCEGAVCGEEEKRM